MNVSPLPSEQHPGQRPAGTLKTIGSMVHGFRIGLTQWMPKNPSLQRKPTRGANDMPQGRKKMACLHPSSSHDDKHPAHVLE
jgi:hypothetical protein